MEIRKVARIGTYHVTINKRGEVEEGSRSESQIKVIEYKNLDDLVCQIMNMNDLIVNEETVYEYAKQGIQYPGVVPLQIASGKDIASGNSDAIEWSKHGAPEQITDFWIDHETDIQVMVGGQIFEMPAVRVK